MKSKIEWTDDVWNPVTGCTKVSPGCKNCYAERMAKRLAGRYGYPKDKPFTPTFHPDRIDQPLKWKKPRKIFVCSMGDLFHRDIVDPFIYYHIMQTIRTCKRHIFIMLTKQPDKMQLICEKLWHNDLPDNLWMGISAEDQKNYDERWEIAKYIPAAVLLVSLEPLLGPIDFHKNNSKPPWLPNWVICGGESGPWARPMNPYWVISIKDQCVKFNIPFFFKQWGEWSPNNVNSYDLKRFAMFNTEENGDKPVYLDYWEKARREYSENYLKAIFMCRWGKKKTGRILDRTVWDQWPEGV